MATCCLTSALWFYFAFTQNMFNQFVEINLLIKRYQTFISHRAYVLSMEKLSTILTLVVWYCRWMKMVYSSYTRVMCKMFSWSISLFSTRCVHTLWSFCTPQTAIFKKKSTIICQYHRYQLHENRIVTVRIGVIWILDWVVNDPHGNNETCPEGSPGVVLASSEESAWPAIIH